MSLIQQLADQLGFYREYTNSFGQQVTANPQALEALLQAMGYQVDDASIAATLTQLEHHNWANLSPPCQIIAAESHQHSIVLHVPANMSNTLTWQLTLETGEIRKGEVFLNEQSITNQQIIDNQTYCEYYLELPQLPLGYHNIDITHANQKQTATLICAPKQCYNLPNAEHIKLWGIAAQLYSLQSENNWGMGDFGDLQQLVTSSTNKGVAAIGLNPLHSLFLHNAAHRSPYSPTSRCFLNTLYIDVSQVDDFEQCSEAQTIINSAAFQQQKRQAKQAELIDYALVAQLKYPVLQALYQHFVRQHLSKNTALAEAFLKFKQQGGESLWLMATFDALYGHFLEQNNAYGWQAWPHDYQNCHSKAVQDFQQKQATEIDYYVFLQWQADRQLSKAQALAKQQMPIGLYLDLAVGCDAAGFDIWANREAYLLGAAVGAPPDAMNTLGQNWGLTPMNPIALKQQAYQPLIQALRANMKYAGAIRIDHILGLFRQYWVAPGLPADQGVYIRFPLDDILRVIALESQRAQCIVIGEDLGTVPDGFSEKIQQHGLLSYKVLYFEQWQTGLFKRPDCYPAKSMVTVSTHDIAPLAGWWCGTDLDWRQQLNLYPNPQMAAQDQQNRVSNRANLIAALEDQQVIDSNNLPQQQPPRMNNELAHAVQKFLAKAPSQLQLIPLEDMLQLTQQVNLPGTVDEHPNWLQKLPVSLNDFWQQQSVIDMTSTLNHARPYLKGKQ